MGILYKNLMTILVVVTTSVNSERGNKDDNYIITHYGTERYTPVKETDYQFHNNGYYKSEIIPVDVKTGEEIKSSNYNNNGQGDTILIPMSAGYSVSVNNNDYPDSNKNDYYNHQTPPSPVVDENKPKRYNTLPKYKKRTPNLNNTQNYKKQTKFIPKNKGNHKLIQDDVYNKNYDHYSNNNYNKRSNLPNKQISRRNKVKNQEEEGAANEGIETYYEKKVKKRMKYF